MLKRTPLYEIHKKLNARLVEFGGWEMPVQYKGVLEEHRAVRNRVGLFDISHMGEIFVEGADAQNFINYITTNDITRISNGGCQYAACCYENGGIVDDVISYQFNPQKYLVVVNASNTDKDFEWFKKNNRWNVSIQNKSSEFCQLALQGPLSEKVLQPLVDFPLSKLITYHFCEAKMICKGESATRPYDVIISRTGYTGEDGFEIYGAIDKAPLFWEKILHAGHDDGIEPIGLAARDTLRLEAAYSLYGHEINETINPFEARLNWIVKLDKSDFIGKEVLQKLKETGARRKLVGLTMIDSGIPRQGYEIFKEDQKVGFVTSGTFSPTLEKPIGMALISADAGQVGEELLVGIRNKKLKAKVIALPFYKRII